MKRAIIACAGVAALFVALGPVTVASGGQRAKVSGREKAFVTPSGTTTSVSHPGKIVLTGTIADYGKVFAANAKGKPTPKGVYRNLELTKGTILVDIAAFNKAITAAFPHATVNKASCSISLTATGRITIVSGTKAYAGITGFFTMTATLAEIAPFKKGVCTTNTTTPALATYSAISGTGRVTVP